MFQKLKKYFSRSYDWPFVVASLLALLSFGILYFNNLQNVGPPQNKIESVAYLGIESGSDLRSNVLFAPHKLFGYLLVKLNAANIVNLRLISVAAVLLAVLIFFLLIKQWFSWRIAAFATVLFATSSWTLFVGRFAAPESMMLVALPVFLYLGSLLKERENDALLSVFTFLSVACLYIPGVWLFALVGSIILSSNILLAWNRFNRKEKSVWVLSAALPLIPLVYGLFEVSALKTWLLWGSLDANLTGFMHNIRYIPSQLFTHGIPDALRWLPGTPILDVATIVLAGLGAIYIFRDSRYPLRRIALAALTLLCVLLIGIFGPTYFSLLLPLIYLFVAGGITFLLDQWFHIFPNNPFARSFGLVLVSLLIVFICAYQIGRYHYVWPRSEVAKNVFRD